MGLRQGDSISSYLFIIDAETLSRLIAKVEIDNQIHGIKISRQAFHIPHLFYTDDVFLFCRANDIEARTIIDILDKYSLISGQYPNILKYNLFFSSNASAHLKNKIIKLIGIQSTVSNITYLGNPICITK